MIERAIGKAAILVEALPYIRSFRRRFVVVKLGGSVMEDDEALNSVVTDVVFMEQVGMWPVLVHGGGRRISAEMEKAGIEPRFVDGLRCTDEPTIEIVERVLIEEISRDLVHRITTVGGRAITLNGRDSSFLIGERKKGADLVLVGEIMQVDKEVCERICDGGLIPVVAPIAREIDGQHLNVNADDCALSVAMALGAAKLVMVSDVEGIFDSDGVLVSSMEAEGGEMLISEGVVTGGMIPKLRSCAQAVGRGVGKVHIVSGMLKHALLLEIFTDQGVGTEIVASGGNV